MWSACTSNLNRMKRKRRLTFGSMASPSIRRRKSCKIRTETIFLWMKTTMPMPMAKIDTSQRVPTLRIVD